MKNNYLIISALTAALLSAAAPGFAQDRDHDRDNRDNGRMSQRDNHDNDRRDNNDHRGDNRNDNRGGDRHYDGAGPSHDLRRGGRLPNQYRNNQYVVSNWREHSLRQPPRGYHWVQTGGDYVLAAVATGIITDMIINGGR